MEEIFQDKHGQWRYRVVGKNGEIMISSEPYVTKSNAVRGFNDLKKVITGLE